MIVLLAGIRPLIEVTKASGSYSHSNKDISFPWAGFINYAFLLQDLYFRVGIRMHAQFLPQWKGCWPPATSPLQLPPRQLIEQRSLACRILILPFLCTIISNIHTYTAHCWWCCVPICLFECVFFFMCTLLPHAIKYFQLKLLGSLSFLQSYSPLAYSSLYYQLTEPGDDTK